MNTFLPMRNKFVYSCSVNIRASGFSELLESMFCILLSVEAFSSQKWWSVGERSGEYSG